MKPWRGSAPVMGKEKNRRGENPWGLTKPRFVLLIKSLFKFKEWKMSLQQICGVAFILFGIGGFLFAEKLFNLSRKLPGSSLMDFEHWPGWMFPAWVLLMRFGGIMCIVTGLLLLIRKD